MSAAEESNTPEDHKYPLGTTVDVNAEVVHPDYPDIPLGGWRGVITGVLPVQPVHYEITWTRETLAGAPKVYAHRCQRLDIPEEMISLRETDVERTSHGPLLMEQPTTLEPEPLAENFWADRVRIVFDLTSDDPLPPNEPGSQATYLEFLADELTLPFPADDLNPEGNGSFPVTVMKVLPNPVDCDGKWCGVCEEDSFQGRVTARLSQVRVPDNALNATLLSDYLTWCEFDETSNAQWNPFAEADSPQE